MRAGRLAGGSESRSRSRRSRSRSRGRGRCSCAPAATGVCHSDLHFVKRRVPPRVPGGPRARVGGGGRGRWGDAVTYVKPGDHVITCLSVFCGECEHCLVGRMSLCQVLKAPEHSAGLLDRRGRRARPPVREPLLVRRADDRARARPGEDPRGPCPSIARPSSAAGSPPGVGAVFHTAAVEPGAHRRGRRLRRGWGSRR